MIYIQLKKKVYLQKIKTKEMKGGIQENEFKEKCEIHTRKWYNPYCTGNNNNSAFNISRSNNKYGASEMME